MIASLADHPFVHALQSVLDHGEGLVEHDPRGNLVIIRRFFPRPGESAGALLVRVLGQSEPGTVVAFHIAGGRVTHAELRAVVERINP